jgi:hypothetical protein
MPIDVRCSCGKAMRVKDEVAGKRIRCPECSAVVSIPRPAGAAKQDLQGELEFYRKLSGSAAARPGELAPNFLRYFLCFPTFTLVCLGLVLVSLALAVLLHFTFAILAMIVTLLLGWYWFRVRAKFVSGCVNPGIVVSRDPPLIAVATDLARGKGPSWPVIKVLAHPLARMAGGPFKKGDRLPTVALYYGEEGPHWLDFEPVAAQCATGDRQEIERLCESIEEEWQVLEAGLRQLPRPLAPGQYRIVPPRPDGGLPQQAELEAAVKRHLSPDPENGRYGPGDAISEVLLTGVAEACATRVKKKEVVGAVAGDREGRGVLLTARSVLYYLGGDEAGVVDWSNLRAASLHFDEVELVTEDHARHRFSRHAFSEENQWLLEETINRVVLPDSSSS